MMLPQMCREDEIVFINKTIERLDSEIQQLSSQKVRLKRRLNDIQATTVVLPAETLSTIFEHVADPESNRTVPVKILGRVSSHWRQIAWSTPTLWTRLTIRVPNNAFNLKVNLAKLYIQNSGSLPMAIRLTNPDDNQIVPEGLVRLLFRDHPEKLKDFVCTFALSEAWWKNVCNNIQSELPNLCRVVLALQRNIPQPNRPPFPLPALTHLSIQGGSHTPLQFPYGQLTTLELHSSIPPGPCLFLLLHNPQLQSFIYGTLAYEPLVPWRRPRDTGTASVISSMLDGGTVTLPNLRELLWPFSGNIFSRFILKCLRLPSLRQLRVRSSRYLATDNEEMRQLRQAFLSSLTNLEFYECPVQLMWDNGGSPLTDGALWSFLPFSIQELSLYDVYNNNDLIHIFHRLALRPPAPGVSELHHNVLPGLKVLSLRFCRIPQLDRLSHPTIFPLFVEALRSRRDGCENASRLERVDFFQGKLLMDGLVDENMEPYLEIYERLVGEGLSVGFRLWGRVRPWICYRRKDHDVHGGTQ